MKDHLFLTDADNTLWDTDAVFRDAQLALLDQVEMVEGVRADAVDRLAYLRELDQLLAQGHHGGLRYPPALLILAVQARLLGARPDRAVHRALLGDTSARGAHEEIVQAFFANLSRRAPLRPGVVTGIARLADAGHRVVVATEGAKEKIEGLLDVHGLRAQVHLVVAAPKTVSLYQRLAKTASGVKMMVGDQIDRDIEPAKRAGFITAWFPGGFVPRWSSARSEAIDIEITSFDRAADAFLSLADSYLCASGGAAPAAVRRTPAVGR